MFNIQHVFYRYYNQIHEIIQKMMRQVLVSFNVMSHSSVIQDNGLNIFFIMYADDPISLVVKQICRKRLAGLYCFRFLKKNLLETNFSTNIGFRQVLLKKSSYSVLCSNFLLAAVHRLHKVLKYHGESGS